MTIVRCPRCRDEVTVPTGASKQALVRCPLCLEQYRLEAALGGVPPALVVVADEGGTAQEGVVHSSDSPHDAAAEYGLERGSASERLFEARPAFGRAPSARPLVAGTPRPRRKEKSMVVEMLKVVVGGAAGLALGLLVLWWGFGQDVGNFGPAVARYAPWIVPAKLHRNTSGNSATSDARPSSPVAGDDAATEDRGGRDGLRLDSRFDDALRQSAPPVATGGETGEPLQGNFGQPVELAPTELDDGSALGLTIDDPLEVTRPASADIELAPLDDFGTGQKTTDEAEVEAADRSDGEKHSAEKLPANRPPVPDLTDLLPAGPFQFSPADDAAPVAEASTATAEPPPVARPQVTPQQLADAVSAADAALARYDALPRDDKEGRQQAFTDLYLAGSETGRVVSLLGTSESERADALDALRAFLDSLSGKRGASKLAAVRFLATQHWGEKEHDEGLLVAGEVKELQSAGALFETTLDASVRDHTLLIPLVSASDPHEFAQVGDQLVVVGRVIDQPQKNLPGYEGDAPRVVLYGDSVVAPKRQ